MANSFNFQDQTYKSGDTVRLHQSVTEGGKSRTQVFEGIVIGIRGSGSGKSITVRKIASGDIGVERIVPLGSPHLTKIELKASGKVRRAKLSYLRSRVGRRATKVKSQTDSNNSNEKSPQATDANKKAKRPARRTTSKTASSE